MLDSFLIDFRIGMTLASAQRQNQIKTRESAFDVAPEKSTVKILLLQKNMSFK